MKNYYEILEVNANASPEVIEKAYKALAKKYHPDRWGKNKVFAERKFKDISEAYSVLSNPELKQNYDMQLYAANSQYNSKYNDLYAENERLKQELNNIKTNKYYNNMNNVINNNTTNNVPHFNSKTVFKAFIAHEKSKTKQNIKMTML